MTDVGFAAVTGASALRAFVAASVATAAGPLIAAELQRRSAGSRRLLWCLLLATILAPDLIAGYAYSNFSLSLIRNPVWNEAFLTLLIGLKATAVAAMMLRFSPEPPLSPAGRHMLRLAGGRIGRVDQARIMIRSGLARLAPAFAVAFLFAFQQFELPSLTAATAWTVTLFDRQALVPDLAESADPLIWPLLVELIVLAPVILFVLRAVASPRRSVPPARRTVIGRTIAWTIATLATFLTAVVPFVVLLRESVPGLGFVLERTPTALAYWHEITVALGYGIVAAVAATALAIGILRLTETHGRLVGVPLLVAACVPGLCGPLVASLFAIEFLQWSWFLPLRDSLVPLVIVLTLFLLPRAVLLESLARSTRASEALHLTRLLRTSPLRSQRLAGRELRWKLDGFGQFCRVGLLATWGYLDLTAATILAPPAVVPVTARLYNLMHYGHNASLSAMTLVAIAIPATVFGLLLIARRLFIRGIRRFTIAEH